MSNQLVGKNELPDVEVLGEWDHGMLDPVLDDDNSSGADLNRSYQHFKAKVWHMEAQVEGAVRNTFHKVEHAIEEIQIKQQQQQEGDADVQQCFDDDLARMDVGVAMIITEDQDKHLQ